MFYLAKGEQDVLGVHELEVIDWICDSWNPYRRLYIANLYIDSNEYKAPEPTSIFHWDDSGLNPKKNFHDYGRSNVNLEYLSKR